MDGARVTRALAIAVGGGLALAACSDATAAESAVPAAAGAAGVLDRMRVEAPASWVRLPAVETAAGAAAAGIAGAVTTIEAWGDPAAGCYAIGIDSRGTRAEGVAASANRLVAELAPLGVAADAFTKPVLEPVDESVAISLGELAGAMRVRIYRDAAGVPQAMALACASNPREPERCKVQCDGLFAQMAPPVMP
jgi:hypothetical protein